MVEIFDDIRKIYKFKAPCGELPEHIEFFSESCIADTSRYIGNECFTVKMFPSWTPTIWINLGSPYRLAAGDGSYTINTGDDVLILRNTIVERHNLPTDHIFTLKFFPGGLEAILDINQAGLKNKVIKAKTILSARLIGSLKKAGSFEERVKLMEAWLLANQTWKRKRDHYLEFIKGTIEMYRGSGLKLNNTEIAEKMFTSSKTINRYFNRVIGVPPKNFFAVLRTRTALQVYVADRKAFSPTAFGYHDMSHFYKDVIGFTGQKLSDFYLK